MANGVANPEVDQTKLPPYMEFLIDDVVTESDDPDTTEFDPQFIDPNDFVRIPIYHNFELAPDLGGIRPFDRLLDILKWNAQTLINLPSLSLKAAGILNNHQGASTRPIVGVAYSGGMLPLVEGFNLAGAFGLGANVRGLVGVGIPSRKPLSIEVVNILTNLVREVPMSGKDRILRLLTDFFDKIPGLGDVFSFMTNLINDFLNAVQAGTTDLALGFLQEIVSEVTERLPGDLPTLNSTSAEFLANVYGSHDEFKILGSSGRADSLHGFSVTNQFKTLINIEIKGATHFDYFRDKDKLLLDSWQRSVNEFVTRLITNSTTKGDLTNFLTQEVGPPDETGYWVVRLPGWEDQP